jgi:hypothetical protein
MNNNNTCKNKYEHIGTLRDTQTNKQLLSHLHAPCDIDMSKGKTCGHKTNRFYAQLGIHQRDIVDIEPIHVNLCLLCLLLVQMVHCRLCIMDPLEGLVMVEASLNIQLASENAMDSTMPLLVELSQSDGHTLVGM